MTLREPVAEAITQIGKEGKEQKAMAQLLSESFTIESFLRMHSQNISYISVANHSYKESYWCTDVPNNIRICLSGTAGGWALGKVIRSH